MADSAKNKRKVEERTTESNTNQFNFDKLFDVRVYFTYFSFPLLRFGKFIHLEFLYFFFVSKKIKWIC